MLVAEWTGGGCIVSIKLIKLPEGTGENSVTIPSLGSVLHFRLKVCQYLYVLDRLPPNFKACYSHGVFRGAPKIDPQFQGCFLLCMTAAIHSAPSSSLSFLLLFCVITRRHVGLHAR